MLSRSHLLYTRILLTLMLATFLSPSMGSGLIVSHKYPAHTHVVADWVNSKNTHSHSHEHSQSTEELQDHQDAHSLIGHLLAHMPADLLESSSLDLAKPTQATPLFFYLPLVPRYLEPPLPPPKVALS